ncbi:MAG: gliding motility-associated C-terminal domain-containing protein [Thermonemataceae bacterium]|nr:gliding motility-associated C-terminal domain-containing protein [Thermonemataceae bacterium]
MTNGCPEKWQTVSLSPEIRPRGGVEDSQYLAMWSLKIRDTDVYQAEAVSYQTDILPYKIYKISFMYRHQGSSSGSLFFRVGNNVLPSSNNTIKYISDNYEAIKELPINGSSGNTWRYYEFFYFNNSPLTYSYLLIHPFSDNSEKEKQKWINIDDFVITIECEYVTSNVDIFYNNIDSYSMPSYSIASRYIQSSNTFIYQNQPMRFIAGKEITLNPGFKTEDGADFEAYIYRSICSKPFQAIGEPSVYIPNGFTANCDGFNDIWEIRDKNKGRDYINATSYELEIWNRWGQSIYKVSGERTPSLKGGDIFWEGIGYPNGTYYYHLNLYNCTYYGSNPKIYKGYIVKLGDGCNDRLSVLNTDYVANADTVNTAKHFPFEQENSQLAEKFSVSPNPSTGSFAVDWAAKENQDFVLTISNQFGNIVFEKKYQNVKEFNDIFQLTKKGIYFVSIRGNNKINYKTFVIH